MKFCVSFVFSITNKVSVNRSAFQDKCIESLLEPETFTGPSVVLFLSVIFFCMAELVNFNARTNTTTIKMAG